MNCPKCGATVAPGSLYCSFCREVIEQPWSQHTQPLQAVAQSSRQELQQPAQGSNTQQGATAGYSHYVSAVPDYAPAQNRQQSNTGAWGYNQPGSIGQETFQPRNAPVGTVASGVFVPQAQNDAGTGYTQQMQPMNPYMQPYAQQSQTAGSYTQQLQQVNPYTQQLQQVNPYTQQSQNIGGYPQQMQPASTYTQQFQTAGDYTRQMVNSYPQQSQNIGGYPQQMQPASTYTQQSQTAGDYTQQVQAVNPYAQQGYPQPTAQSYAYQGRMQRQPNQALTMLSELPGLFLGCFTNPGQVLRTLVERSDVVIGPIVLAVALVVVFLGGMAAMRGVVSMLFSFITSLTGISLANSSSALRQGINYIAGQIAPAVGGIAVLCQLIAIVVPVAVIAVYLYLVLRNNLNWVLVLEMVTVTTLPTVIIALLGMLGSMLSPVLVLVTVVIGVVIAYLQLGHMLSHLLGSTDGELHRIKMVCFPVALLLTFGFIYLLGGTLLGSVFQRMISLLGNMGAMV